MNPFRTYTFPWWQISLLKISMIAFGLAVGANWPTVFTGFTTVLWLVFALPAAFLAFVSIKQLKA